MKTIIFICHGNICRSPAAKYIFDKKVGELHRKSDFLAISRAVSYEEIGNDIYPPMKRTLRDNDIPFSLHHAEIITKEDLEKADYIFYMDESNKNRLIRMFGNNPKFLPIFEFTDSINEIEDPWYSGRYQLVVTQLSKCIDDILKNM